ncbi:MAG: hypothetical protein OSJ52_12830 [Lachnospiraceae bacterium]|nr:hypothetical protein [Lachnospiraceae bacterium]
MTNAILTGISQALDKEFGYKIYTEEKRQGLEEPCLFLSCVSLSNTLLVGHRYSREEQFCIQYLPKSEMLPREECYAAAERLTQCLELIEEEGCLIRGTKMKYEVIDDVLHFFVNYDRIVRRGEKELPSMEEIFGSVEAKG